MKTFKKIVLSILIVVSTLSISQFINPEIPTNNVVQAVSIKLNTKKKSLNVGKTYTLKLSKTKKKVKWSSSNKKIATVNSKGKVTAKKKGTCTITAKIGKSKYKCKITVIQPKSITNSKSATVYITNSGKKYHTSNCRYLRNSKIKTTLKSAKSKGYTACKICKP